MRREDLEQALAFTLGVERSREVVRDAKRRLGIEGDELTAADVEAILVDLTRITGAVGVAARSLRQRTSLRGLAAPEPPGRSVAASKPDVRAEPRPDPTGVTGKFSRAMIPGAGAPTISREEIVGIFRAVVGEEKATDVVDATMRHLGLAGEGLGRDDALAVLDALAAIDGIIGVTARFAKARVLLRRG